jgi:hypothetical protein
MLKFTLFSSFLILLLQPPTSYAQLTVFNVSSSDITEARKISVQQQFEIQDQIESSTTLTYGLGKGWEAGLNLNNLDYGLKSRQFEFNDTTTAIPYAPLVLANAQKSIELTQNFLIGLGAVAGTNVSSFHHSRFVYYTYANLEASFGVDDRFQFVAGSYYGNHRYLSDGPVVGFQTGMEAGIWPKKIHILADWISGSHGKGRLTAGLEFFITERLPIAIGWQRSNADGSQGAVFQLTFIPGSD